MLETPNRALPNSQRWLQRLLWAGCSIFGVLLGVLVYIGSTSRFMQDDYCFSVILSQKSLVDIYLHETTFSSNRFMLVLTTALSERLGAWSVQVLPGFLVVMWVSGLTLTLNQAYLWLVSAGKMNQELTSRTAWLLQVMVSEIIVSLSLYAAPNLVQIFYWRAGSLTYLAPLVVFSFLAGWMIRSLRRPKIGVWAWLLTFLLAFGAAGYCETAAVFQMGGLALATAVVWVENWRVRKVNGQAIWLLISGWAGSLFAVVIMLSSPANAPRFAASYQTPPNVWSGIWGALDGAFLFIKLTFYWLPVTVLFVVVFFALLSYLVQFSAGMEILSGKWILIGMAGLALSVYLCMAASMFPSYYIESSYPADRALLTARWISILGLAGFGWLLGSSLRFMGQLPWVQAVPFFGMHLALWVSVSLFGVLMGVFILIPKGDLREASFPEIREFAGSQGILVLWSMVGILAAAAFVSWMSGRQPGVAFGFVFMMTLLAFVQPLQSSWMMVSEIPKFSARAILWDRRDALIRQMAAAGQQEITVRALDSLAGIGELHEDTNFWVNRCAAWYYQVSSIRAVEPVLTLP